MNFEQISFACNPSRQLTHRDAQTAEEGVIIILCSKLDPLTIQWQDIRKMHA